MAARRPSAQKRPLRGAAQPDRAARDGVAAAVPTTEREAHDIRRGRHLGLLALAPSPQANTDECRVEAKGIPDSIEVERPLPCGRRDTHIRLGALCLPAAPAIVPVSRDG